MYSHSSDSVDLLWAPFVCKVRFAGCCSFVLGTCLTDTCVNWEWVLVWVIRWTQSHMRSECTWQGLMWRYAHVSSLWQFWQFSCLDVDARNVKLILGNDWHFTNINKLMWFIFSVIDVFHLTLQSIFHIMESMHALKFHLWPMFASFLWQTEWLN